MNPVYLRDIAEISSGQGAPQGEKCFGTAGYPFVRAGSLDLLLNGRSEDSIEKVNDKIAREYQLRLFPKGTILFAKSGMSATKDRVYMLKRECYVVNHLATIIPDKKTDPLFLMYWFQQFRPSRLIKDKSYPSIRLSDIEEIKMPVISLKVQRKIASILEKAESAREKRRSANRLTDEFLESAFLEMFGDPALNTKKIPLVKCGDISSHVSSGLTPLGGQKTYLKSGILFIRSQNVHVNKLDLSDVAYISDAVHNKMKRTWVKNGDVLLNITGASIGRVAYFIGKDNSANVNQHVCIIRPKKEKIVPEYLSFLISMPNYQKKIFALNAGATRQAFNFEQIKKFEIPIAPMEHQKKFAELVQKVEKLKEKQRESEKELDNLFNSLMQRAFRGELN